MNNMHKFTIILLALCACALNACSKDNQTQSATEENSSKLIRQELKTSGLDVEKIDINKDGRADQISYSKDGVIQYYVRDFNFDGTPDMTEFYENGVHYRDEIDLDYDGICDVIVTYKDGLPVKKEFSIDFQGNRHGTQLFDAQGNRVEIQRDTNGDGLLDTYEKYNAGEDTPYSVSHITPMDAQ